MQQAMNEIWIGFNVSTYVNIIGLFNSSIV